MKLTTDSSLFRDLVSKIIDGSFHPYFEPVTITHGRKFRGFGYIVSDREKSNGGFSGSGVRPLKYYNVYRVYVPKTNSFDEFNGDPTDAEIATVPPKVFEADLTQYLVGLLEACVKRCGDDIKWRKNYLRKMLGIPFESSAARLLAEAL